MNPSSAIISPSSWTEHLPLEELFDAEHPLEIDLGCGKGRFIMARATKYPNTNFLGLDRMSSRMKKVDKKITRTRTSNVKLLMSEASYAIQRLIPPSTVSIFHILFPDPWPKRKHHRRRLFSAEFIDSLYTALQPNGLINATTDHLEYFEYITALFNADPRFIREPTPEPPEDERTDFEIIFTNKGQPINRGSFRAT